MMGLCSHNLPFFFLLPTAQIHKLEGAKQQISEDLLKISEAEAEASVFVNFLLRNQLTSKVATM